MSFRCGVFRYHDWITRQHLGLTVCRRCGLIKSPGARAGARAGGASPHSNGTRSLPATKAGPGPDPG